MKRPHPTTPMCVYRRNEGNQFKSFIISCLMFILFHRVLNSIIDQIIPYFVDLLNPGFIYYGYNFSRITTVMAKEETFSTIYGGWEMIKLHPLLIFIQSIFIIFMINFIIKMMFNSRISPPNVRPLSVVFYNKFLTSNLLKKSQKSIQIRVFVNGKYLFFYNFPNITVSRFLKKVAKKCQMKTRSFNLYCKFKQLIPGKLLKDYGLNYGDLLVLKLKLNGGMNCSTTKQQVKTYVNSAEGSSLYKNLNLKDHKKCLNEEGLTKCQKASSSVNHYEYTAPTTSNKNSTTSFKTGRKSLCVNENVVVISDKTKKKDKRVVNGKHASTLSLHIAAYENSFEAVSTSGISSTIRKNCMKENNSSMNSASINQEFEFPRQQTDDISKPEIMDFKASQQLLDPNSTPSKRYYCFYCDANYSNTSGLTRHLQLRCSEMLKCFGDHKLCHYGINRLLKNDIPNLQEAMDMMADLYRKNPEILECCKIAGDKLKRKHSARNPTNRPVKYTVYGYAFKDPARGKEFMKKAAMEYVKYIKLRLEYERKSSKRQTARAFNMDYVSFINNVLHNLDTTIDENLKKYLPLIYSFFYFGYTEANELRNQSHFTMVLYNFFLKFLPLKHAAFMSTLLTDNCNTMKEFYELNIASSSVLKYQIAEVDEEYEALLLEHGLIISDMFQLLGNTEIGEWSHVNDIFKTSKGAENDLIKIGTILKFNAVANTVPEEISILHGTNALSPAVPLIIVDKLRIVCDANGVSVDDVVKNLFNLYTQNANSTLEVCEKEWWKNMLEMETAKRSEKFEGIRKNSYQMIAMENPLFSFFELFKNKNTPNSAQINKDNNDNTSPQQNVDDRLKDGNEPEDILFYVNDMSIDDLTTIPNTVKEYVAKNYKIRSITNNSMLNETHILDWVTLYLAKNGIDDAEVIRVEPGLFHRLNSYLASEKDPVEIATIVRNFCPHPNSKTKLLFLPICYSNHWTAYVVDFVKNRAIYYDPRGAANGDGGMKGLKRRCLYAVIDYRFQVNDIDLSFIYFKPVKSMLQMDSYNCGIYVVEFVLNCINNIGEAENANFDIQRKRQSMIEVFSAILQQHPQQNNPSDQHPNFNPDKEISNLESTFSATTSSKPCQRLQKFDSKNLGDPILGFVLSYSSNIFFSKFFNHFLNN